ncbi:hypothetical protein RXV95_12575 [Novosphingobium sp. ZN18A2]|uniref:hypothetical protein n=1 Tax=Novosphingobium sp. ZN18A2 TaxID=3079861 RepID=UPI0030CAC662
MGWREQLRELAGAKGSLGLAALVALGVLLPGAFRLNGLSAGSFVNAAVWAIAAVALVQVAARVSPPRNLTYVLAIGSAALAWLLFGPQIMGGGDAASWLIAAALWAGISLAAFAALMIYRQP